MSDNTGAAEAVKRQRIVQDEVDRLDAGHKSDKGGDAAMQAGARVYPAPLSHRSTTPSRGRKVSSNPSPCMTPRTIGARRNSRVRLR